MLFSRAMLILFAAIALFFALFSPGYLVTIGAVATGGTAQILPPLLGMFFWPRSTKEGCIAGLLGGLITVVVTQFTPGFVNPLGIFSGVWGLLVNSILFVVVSLATKPPPMDSIRAFHKALQS